MNMLASGGNLVQEEIPTATVSGTFQPIVQPKAVAEMRPIGWYWWAGAILLIAVLVVIYRFLKRR